MDIVVLAKQVPDTNKIKIDPKTGSLIRKGVESIINPDDRHALELAIKLTEKFGGKTTVISMGPPQAIDVISEAIGMGIDEGILLTDKNFGGADTWSTAFTLGTAIKKLKKYDLIICGKQAIDGDTAHIGPQVAEFMNIPQMTYIRKVEEVIQNTVVVQRALENGYERMQCSLPVLISVMCEINSPRYPRLDFLINACEEKANIKIWDVADLGVKVQEIGLSSSLTMVVKTFAPKIKRECEMIKGSKQKVAKKLLQKLQKKNLI